MKRVVAIFMVVLAALATATARAEPQVRAYAESTTVPVNSPFRITIEVNGTTAGSAPQLPAVDGLVSNNPPSTSSSTQIQIIGGKSSIIRTQQYTYLTQATRTGKITIPSIAIEVDGQTQTTAPIILTVTDAPPIQAGRPPGGRLQNPFQPPPPPPPPQPPDTSLSWNDAVLTESSVDKKEVFQGEPVHLTLTLWVIQLRGLQVVSQSGQNIDMPKAEGFYVVTQPQPTRDTRERNGRTYEIMDFHVTLYPTATGDARIGAWRWEGTGVYGYNRHSFSLEAPAIDIKVKPLPDRPPNFSGAVGTFTAKAQLMQDQVIQGVPTKLMVRISGRGNPEAIGTPAPPQIANAYVSDPEKEVKSNDENGDIAVEKSFVYTITPLAAGDMTVPEVAFCYFDPAAATYQTVKTNPFSVRVLPSTETGSRVLLSGDDSVVEKRSTGVDVLGEDILPIITEARALRPSRPSSMTTPALFSAPVLAYGALALFMRRRRRFETDSAYARNYHAKSKGHKRLEGIRSAAEPAEELYHALTGFMADKFDVSESGMTSSDAVRLLESHGVASDLVANFAKMLRACERARYASSGLSGDEMAALTKAASDAIDRLDAAVRKGRRS